MRRPKSSLPDLVAELRTVLASAIPPQHHAQVAAIGRVLLDALDPSGEAAAATPAQATPATPAPVTIEPTPLSPRFERILATLRSELDRQGIEPTESRRRAARIPLVNIRPWRVVADEPHRTSPPPRGDVDESHDAEQARAHDPTPEPNISDD